MIRILLTDWNMFCDSSNGIEEYKTSDTRIINKLIDDIVATVSVRTNLNKKSWITGKIHTKLNARAAAFKERDTNPDNDRKSRYALRQTIKHAKRQFWTKLQSYHTGSDPCWMWQGLKTITD